MTCEEKLEMYKEQNTAMSLMLIKATKALQYYGWEDDDQGHYARSVLEDFGYTQQMDHRK